MASAPGIEFEALPLPPKESLYPSAPPPYSPEPPSMDISNIKTPPPYSTEPTLVDVASTNASLYTKAAVPVAPAPTVFQTIVVPQPVVSIPTTIPMETQIIQRVQVETLPPGACSVCRKGHFENSASCCTWITCCLLLPLGIIPGLIAFCCCCRHPKCTNCGFTY